MGSTVSHMSFEWVIAAGIAGTLVYVYTTYSKSDSGARASTSGNVAKGKKKKRKIQMPKTGISELSEKPVSVTATTTAATIPTTQGSPVPGPGPIVVPFPHVIMPGEFETVLPSLDERGAHATKSKGKRKKQKQSDKEAAHDVEQQALHPAAASGSSGTAMHNRVLKEEEEELRMRPSSPSFDTDSSWARIDHHDDQRTRPRGVELKAAATRSNNKRNAITADLTTGNDVDPLTGDLPVAERMNTDKNAGAMLATDIATSRDDSNRRTLAEKLLPKPRKTTVDDMLERSDYPGLARVIRVQPRADEVPAPGFSWQDYQDVDNGNDTLNEGEGEWDVVKSKARLSSKEGVTFSPQVMPKAPEQLTQKQRQNARRNQMLKAAKAEAETERLAKLAERRRALERERIIEQSRRGASKATVDSRGKLVYD